MRKRRGRLVREQIVVKEEGDEYEKRKTEGNYKKQI
jgi:hypothetical protein